MAERAKVAVLISGRGSNMAALLYASRHPDCPFEIALVASNDPEAPGLALAEAEGVPTFALSHGGMKRAEFDAILDREIRGADARTIALAGYMRLLSPAFIAGWKDRILNIHPSLLPKYRGLDPHAQTLAAGDAIAGCTVHIVTDDLDAGPILGQIQVAVLPGDTVETLSARTLIAEHQLYSRCLADFVTREASPEWILGQIRERALALPETEEKSSHGSPGFRVKGGKFFAYFSYDHHHDGVTGLIVKTSGGEEQAMLTDAEPELYYRPAYLGPSGWIGIRLDGGEIDWDHIERWLRKSWSEIAPRKLQALAEFLG